MRFNERTSRNRILGLVWVFASFLPISVSEAYLSPDQSLMLDSMLAQQDRGILLSAFNNEDKTQSRDLILKRRAPASLVRQWIQSKTKRLPSSVSKGISETVLRESRKHAVDPVLILAVIQTESSFRHNARGAHGEIGLMQLKPTTAQWLAHKVGARLKKPDELVRPVLNIRLGAAYLGFLSRRYSHHNRTALDAYNRGMGKIARGSRAKRELSRYYARVMSHYFRIQAELVNLAKPALLPANYDQTISVAASSEWLD